MSEQQARPFYCRPTTWLIAGGVAIAGYLGAAWWAGDLARANASVAGVELGGHQAPADQLRAGLGPRLQAPVPVSLGDAETTLDPTAAGLSVDVEATVEAATGFSLHPAQVYSRLAGRHDVAPVIRADDSKLRGELERISTDLGITPADAAVTFTDGQLHRVEPITGVRVDPDRGPDAVTDAWLTTEAIDLPTRTTAPDIDATDLESFLTTFAEPAVAGPVRLDVAGTPVTLAPAAYAPALAATPVDGELRGTVDGAALVRIILESGQGVAAEAHDARFEFVDGAPQIVPSAAGAGIEPDVASAALEQAFTAQERVAKIETTTVQPAVTTADLEAAGVNELVSEFSTRMSGSAGRRENITIAADTINGSYLAPGQTFSMNEVLGPRTTDKGYNRAPVIMNGRMTTGTGGGVSQVATTLYNGAFFAGMTDVEHKPHSLYISRYPVGREATVNYPDVDLKFANDSPHGVLIQMYVADGQVTTRFWSTKVYDITAEASGRYNYRSPRTITDNRASCTPQSPSTGFDVTVTRIFSQGGVEVKREKTVASYIAANRVVCGDDQAKN